MTPRETLHRMVETSANFTNTPISRVWDRLYGGFELELNQPFRRMAYNNGATNLDLIDELGHLGRLVEFARGTLRQNPTLSEQKKAPVQGDLEGGLP